jgi:hypothetical protein
MRYLALLPIVLVGCVAVPPKPVVASSPPAVVACERHEHLGAKVTFDKGFEKCATILQKFNPPPSMPNTGRSDKQIIDGVK